MPKFTVFIGLNRGASFSTGPVAISTPEAISHVAKLLRNNGIPGATILPGFGVWEGNLEPSLTVLIHSDGDGVVESVASFAGEVCGDFRQDSVGVACGEFLGYITPNMGYRENEATVESLIRTVSR